jgi:hypothetical protein
MESTSRIFVTTSPINVVFYLLYIQSKKNERYKDVLIICNRHMNQHSYEKLSLLASQHEWNKIIKTNDLEQYSPHYNVTFRKRFIRKIRNYKFFQPIYNSIRSIYENNEKNQSKNWLKEKIDLPFESVEELNLLTETSINSALFDLFPEAKINYFEHGLSDYIMIETIPKFSNFYCLFENEFRTYFKNKEIKIPSIIPIYRNDIFNRIAANYLYPLMNEFNEVFKSFNSSTKYVLILMQDFENLGVSSEIHVQLFNKILNYLDEFSTSVTFLIKPHPKQSSKALNEIDFFFKQAKLNFYFLNSPCFKYTSIELFFYLIKDLTTHVFSYYSSGLFYLSKLYPDTKIKYLYTFDHILTEIDHMPKEVGAIHLSFIQNQKQLFIKNCIEF